MDARAVLAHEELNKFMFFPTKTQITYTDTIGRFEHVATEGLAPCEPEHFDLLAYVKIFHNDPAGKTLVYFHGNGENIGYPAFVLAHSIEEGGQDPLRVLQDAHVNLVLCEYRGYSNQPGFQTALALLEDVRRFHDMVVERLGIPTEAMIVMGRSMGSIPAIHFAQQYPTIAGLAIDSGMADPRSLFLPRRQNAEEHAAEGVTIPSEAELDAAVVELLLNRTKIRDYGGPVLILHTNDDHIIPFQQARELFTAAAQLDEFPSAPSAEAESYRVYKSADSRVTLVQLMIGSHNNIYAYNEAAYSQMLREWTIESCHHQPRDEAAAARRKLGRARCVVS